MHVASIFRLLLAAFGLALCFHMDHHITGIMHSLLPGSIPINLDYTIELYALHFYDYTEQLRSLDLTQLGSVISFSRGLARSES